VTTAGTVDEATEGVVVETVVAGTTTVLVLMLADDDPQGCVQLEDAAVDAGVLTDVVHAPLVVVVTVFVDFVLVPVVVVVTGVELAGLVVVVVVVLLLPPPPIFNPSIASQSAMPAPTGIALVNPPTTVPLVIPYGLVALTLHTHQLSTASKFTFP